MSALSNWVTCGMVFQARLRCSAVLRRTPLIGLALDLAALAEVGQRARLQRRGGAAGRGGLAGAAEAAHHALGELLDVVDARCARRDRCPSPARCRRRSRARAGGRTARPGPTSRAEGAGQRRRPADARRRCPRPAPSAVRPRPVRPAPAAGAGCGRLPARAPRLPRAASGFGGSACGGAPAHAHVHDQHDLARLHLVARLDADVLDHAGQRRRHFDGRLVGLEFEDRLVHLRPCRRSSPARSSTSPCATSSPRFGRTNSAKANPREQSAFAVQRGSRSRSAPLNRNCDLER